MEYVYMIRVDSTGLVMHDVNWDGHGEAPIPMAFAAVSDAVAWFNANVDQVSLDSCSIIQVPVVGWISE